MPRKNGVSWSDEELASLRLNDKRLEDRAAWILDLLSSYPSLSIPTCCTTKGDEDAVYRFFANQRVSAQKILAAHFDTTVRRASAYSRVVVPQDTTEFDFTRPSERVGGALNGGTRRGFLAHVLLATAQDGVPLGLVAAKFWTRPINKTKKGKAYWKKPLDKKESGRWLDGYRRIAEFKARLPKETQVIAVSDSEGDIYECLAARPTPDSDVHPNFVVRACHDRLLANDTTLYRELREAPVLSKKTVHVRAQRPASFDGRRRKAGKKERDAVVEVRAQRVTVMAPKDKPDAVPSTDINAVFVSEPNPPPGQVAIEWMLLTDLPIDTLAAVEDVIEIYGQRWGIEVYFYTLKSGCQVEQRQLEADQNLTACIAMYMVVAWRVEYLTMLARSNPDLPCDAVLETDEWRAAYAATQKRRPPRRAPSLSTMLPMIASLGGFRAKRDNPTPGPKSVWIGLQRLKDIALGWSLQGCGPPKPP
jgi:hypothetical protein